MALAISLVWVLLLAYLLVNWKAMNAHREFERLWKRQHYVSLLESGWDDDEKRRLYLKYVNNKMRNARGTRERLEIAKLSALLSGKRDARRSDGRRRFEEFASSEVLRLLKEHGFEEVVARASFRIEYVVSESTLSGREEKIPHHGSVSAVILTKQNEAVPETRLAALSKLLANKLGLDPEHVTLAAVKAVPKTTAEERDASTAPR